MSSRLVFSARSHLYSLDGGKVPGVTGIISRATDKPALVYAAAREAAWWCADNVALLDSGMATEAWVKTAANHPRSVWNGKAQRGTLLHDAARQLVGGEPLTPETDGEPWPDDVRQSAEQLARFMDEWDVEPLYTERPVFHEGDRWAGTVDLVARLRGGRRWLLDYKTGETGIYPKDAMQLAAYRNATHMQVDHEGELRDIPMPVIQEAACVWVRPDCYELRPVRSDGPMYDVFRSMVPVADWVTWDRDETVGPPLPVPAVAS